MVPSEILQNDHKYFPFWQHIRALEGQMLHTLKQGKPFQVVRVSDESVLIYLQSTRNERLIARKQLEASFQHLQIHRELTLDVIDKEYAPRNPVYVAAILNTFPDVHSSTDTPLKLLYKG